MPLLDVFLCISVNCCAGAFGDMHSSVTVTVAVYYVPCVLRQGFCSFLFLCVLTLYIRLSSFPFVLAC